MITWYYGNTGSGKSSEANKHRGSGAVVLDADELRERLGFFSFSEMGRRYINDTLARFAMMLDAQGFDVIVCSICPYADQRADIQQMIEHCRFIYLSGGDESNAPLVPFEETGERTWRGQLIKRN